MEEVGARSKSSQVKRTKNKTKREKEENKNCSFSKGYAAQSNFVMAEFLLVLFNPFSFKERVE